MFMTACVGKNQSEPEFIAGFHKVFAFWTKPVNRDVSKSTGLVNVMTLVNGGNGIVLSFLLPNPSILFLSENASLIFDLSL
ncbi:hypothetical protein RRG08_025237 [Elysia crispata]|uniref:Uncharacterized protein n=1 Tax=Elysia crispata TaxID=231223 RepID=A0AAE1A9Z4_9GAST|nr:hypothetical protein RRG08_025237 [Elysia crispata]